MNFFLQTIYNNIELKNISKNTYVEINLNVLEFVLLINHYVNVKYSFLIWFF